MTLAFDHPPLTDSWLSRRDPRWKLAALALAVAAVLSLQGLPMALAALLAALTLAAAGGLPRRWLLIRLGIILLLLAPFALVLPFLHAGTGSAWELGPLRLSLAGLRAASLLVVKALSATTLVLVLLATAPLHATLKAAQSLRVPAVLVQLAGLTYRYLFVLADELARLRIALRVRGYRNRATLHSYRTIGHLAGTLLVRGHERAERVGQAMRCRGFDGRFRNLTTWHTQPADLVLFALIVGTAAALVIADCGLWIRMPPSPAVVR
jgi:cobalt/nickel transport system permease protein